MALLVSALLVCGFQASTVYGCVGSVTDEQLCETPEIQFETGEAITLQEKAQALGSIVNIYEHIRNNTDYAPYHGARSNTLNTFWAMEGNDVDLASTLIALYRSVGVKARYAVGDIRLSRADIANWTSIENETLAVSVLGDQGINIVDDTDPDYVTLEHVWVEALVDFSNYRGGSDTIQTCTEESDRCSWIALDPSFKLRSYQPQYRGLLASLDFDYDAYYNAESNQDLRDKNPLEIFEESALEYLRVNHPGLTLEDVIDDGEILAEKLGLLPASLPYEVIGDIQRYDSIQGHDEDAEAGYDWNKNVAVNVYPIVGGEACDAASLTGNFSVAALTTQQLSVNWGAIDGQMQFAMLLDGTNQSSLAEGATVSCNGSDVVVTEGLSFNIVLTVDASPLVPVRDITYSNLLVGGFYQVAIGGYPSNWGQVRNAYKKLLSANEQYPLIDDAAGDVYVDDNGNGSVDAGDSLLIDNQSAQDALTGGLLHTAQALYFARLKEHTHRYGRLKNTVFPIDSFAGVVSTTYSVELVDETPFAVLPGGLLIDLKGIYLNGIWEASEAEVYSSESFKFFGHFLSALEHEIWQELTGYDAISTVRGIQLALENGATLMDIHNTATEDTFEASMAQVGISHGVPADFVQKDYTIFNRRLVAWMYTGNDSDNSNFYVFNGDPDVMSIDGSSPLFSVYYPADNNINTDFSFFGNKENLYNGMIADGNGSTYTANLIEVTLPSGSSITETPSLSGSDASKFTLSYQMLAGNVVEFNIKPKSTTAAGSYLVTLSYTHTTGSSSSGRFVKAGPVSLSLTCDGSSYSGQTAYQALTQLENCFNSYAASQTAVDLLDRDKGFDPALAFYKNEKPALTEYSFDFIKTIREGLYSPEAGLWYNYTAPTQLAEGAAVLFEVYIQDRLTTAEGNLASTSYKISNQSTRLTAGGGYVDWGSFLDPAESTEGVEGSGATLDVSDVMFNDELFNSYINVGIVTNDLWRTASTVDPVSTITGNMYHDETDVMIAGRGLPYTLTRTYNSNKTTTSGPDSSNPDYFPLSQGWTHSYNMKLVANDYGQYPNYDTTLSPENENGKTSSITYVNERGGENNYLLDDSDTAAQPTSAYAEFDTLALDSPSTGLHTITFSNGVVYTFDSQGEDLRVPGSTARLHRIEDPYGNQLNFTYTNDQLTAITDNLGLSGRTGLVLAYHASGENIGRLDTVTDWTGRQWVYSYANGQLSGVQNPLSDSMAYTYVTDTHLLKDIIHPQDRDGTQKTMTFAYYENGQAFNYIDQEGSEESLSYDLYRRKTRITNPLGDITEHYYDQNGALTKLVEADNGILLFENNEDGLRYLKTNALGQQTRYSYHTSRDLTGVASDTNGQVTREEDALGNTLDYDYGVHNQITTVNDKNGNTFTNEYYATTDAAIGAVAGKLYKKSASNATVNGVAYADVTLAEFQYHPDGTLKQQVQYSDPAQPSKKSTADYTYLYADDGSYTSTITVTDGATTITTQQSYDDLWRLVSSTISRRTSVDDATPVVLTSTYEYDDLGRAVKTTDPVGNIAETLFDKNGNVAQSIVRYKLLPTDNSALKPQCTIDAEYPDHHSCVVASHQYDKADRLVSSTDVMGATVHYEYNASFAEMAQVAKVTNDLGNSLYFEYDAKDRRTQVTDEKGYTVITAYDLAGRVKQVTDANNNSISYTYDSLGRQLTVTTPEGRATTFDEYDGNGNLLRMTDANGVVGEQPLNSQNASVYNEFDEFNRLVSSLNADNEQTRYTYDLTGNRTSVIDAKNQTTNFIYDELGRLTTVVDPIVETGTDKVVSITYDELGNRLTYTDRLGEVTHYTYDTLNRLVEEHYLTDGITATKVYDQYGDMVTTSYGANSYSYVYDAAHRLLSKTDNRSGLSLGWEYDSVGNLLTKTTYQGEIQRFGYDSSNRLVAMSASTSLVAPAYLQASYHYDPAGRLLSRILSNGAATLYGYSVDGFLTSIKQVGADGGVLDLREYQHDQVGNITKLTHNGAEVIDYAYDPAYRLTSADSDNNLHDLGYTYDDVGNRLTKTANGSTQHYLYGNGNRLDEVCQDSNTGAMVYSFIYDDNGSMTEKLDAASQPILQVDYDQRRLASVMAVNGQPNSMAFQYDPHAYRIEKQNTEGTKKYYLEAENLESVYDEMDELQANYLRGVVVDEIINGFERNDSGVMENRTFHHDQVNSVVAVSDHNGAAVQTLSYGPFGESFGVTGNSQNAMQYTGREQDAESGLYYYRARYYDPELGRFISEDPIGFAGGVNFYAYVGNNPMGFNDPSGNIAASSMGGGSFGGGSGSGGSGGGSSPYSKGSGGSVGASNYASGDFGGALGTGSNPFGENINDSYSRYTQYAAGDGFSFDQEGKLLRNLGILGSAFQGKAGVGLTLMPKVKLGPISVKAGGKAVIAGVEADLSGDMTILQEAEAGIVLTIGKLDLGYKTSSYRYADDGKGEVWTGGVLGWKYNGSRAVEWAKIGVEGIPFYGVAEYGGSIDFEKIYEAVTNWE